MKDRFLFELVDVAACPGLSHVQVPSRLVTPANVLVHLVVADLNASRHLLSAGFVDISVVDLQAEVDVALRDEFPLGLVRVLHLRRA